MRLGSLYFYKPLYIFLPYHSLTNCLVIPCKQISTILHHYVWEKGKVGMYINRLNKGLIESLPDGLHADGGNLYLKKRGTARSWIFRYKLNYKTFELGLGSAYVIPLAEARKKAMNLRHDIVNGVYPSTRLAKEKKAREEARRVAIGDTITLGDILEPALRHNFELKRMRTPTYVEQYSNRMRKHFPDLCKKVLSLITVEDVASAVKKFEGKSTSAKVLSTLRVCFSFAKAKGLYKGQNPAEWKEGLNMFLPPSVSTSRKHHASLDWKKLPEFYRALSEAKKSKSRTALQLIILTAARLSEITELQEEDIDSEKLMATCRSTKTSTAPVSFPFPTQARPMLKNPRFWLGVSGVVIANAIKRLGYEGITIHGFRASFSTWCAENGKDPEMRERCLGHAVDTKVAACYQRSDLLERRRALIQEWADYVTGSSSD